MPSSNWGTKCVYSEMRTGKTYYRISGAHTIVAKIGVQHLYKLNIKSCILHIPHQKKFSGNKLKIHKSPSLIKLRQLERKLWQLHFSSPLIFSAETVNLQHSLHDVHYVWLLESGGDRLDLILIVLARSLELLNTNRVSFVLKI